MSATTSQRHWERVDSTAHYQSKTLSGIRLSEVIGIFWFSTLFLLEMGIKNGELNQVFYLLHGMRRADPTFLRGDWLTWNSVPYHIPYDFLVAGLARAGLLEVGLTVGTVLMTVVFTVAVYAGMRSLYERPLLPWAVTLMLFAGLFTRGLGDWYLLPNSVEPFGISGAAIVAGFAFLAWQRPLEAGISLGVGAFMHAHFAVLIAAILGLTTLVQVRRLPLSYVLKLWLPYLVLATPSLLRVYTFASAPGGAEAYEILSGVGPQHYRPWLTDWKPFVGFGAAGLMGVSGLLLRRPRWNPDLFVPVGVAAVIVIGSLILGYLDWFHFIQQALLGRLTSFLVLAGVTAGAAALVEYDRRLRFNNFADVTLLVSFGLFLVASTPRFWLAAVVACAVPIANVAARRPITLFSKHRRAIVMIPFVVVSIGMLPVAYRELSKSHIKIRPVDNDRINLYEWARNRTAVGSIFAVPPGWKDFRLNAQRAIVADWGATPFYPDDVLEWNRRIQDLTGLERPRTLQDVESAYKKLDCQRAEFLHRRYNTRYFVVGKGQALPCGTTVYSDGAYYVVDSER